MPPLLQTTTTLAMNTWWLIDTQPVCVRSSQVSLIVHMHRNHSDNANRSHSPLRLATLPQSLRSLSLIAEVETKPLPPPILFYEMQNYSRAMTYHRVGWKSMCVQGCAYSDLFVIRAPFSFSITRICRSRKKQIHVNEAWASTVCGMPSQIMEVQLKVYECTGQICSI